MSIAFGPGISCGRPLLAECGLPEFGPVSIQAVPGQTGDQLRILDTSSNVVAGFDINGNLIGAGASPSGSVILAPNSVNRNLIQPTGDANKGLAIQAHSDTQSAPLLEITGGAINTATAGPYLTVGGAGGGNRVLTVQDWNFAPSHEGLVTIKCDATNAPALSVWGDPSGSADTVQFWEPDGAGNYAARLLTGGYGLFFAKQTSILAHCLSNASIYSDWADSTDATRKGKLRFTCWDASGERTCLTLETSGTAPMTGFLGAAAVVRQTNGTAADLAAIADPATKAFLTALSNGLVNFGLFAAPA